MGLTPVRMSKYVMDNSKVNGFGALMIGPGTSAVALSAARDIAKVVAIVAAATEGEATAAEVAPGHVTSTFSRAAAEITPTEIVIMDGPHANPRSSARISYTGRDTGAHDGSPALSDPIVLEAGSRFNEGTKGDRPALRVLSRALGRVFASDPSMHGERR